MKNTVPLVWEQNIKITLLFQNVVVHVTLSLHSSTTCVFVFVGFCFQFYWFAHHISRLRVHPVYSDRLQAGWSVSIHRLVAHCHVQKDFDPIILPSNGDFRLSQRIIVDHSHVTKAQMMNAWSSISTPPIHIYGTVTRTETTFHKILYVSKMLKISIWLLQHSFYNCAILHFWK